MSSLDPVGGLAAEDLAFFDPLSQLAIQTVVAQVCCSFIKYLDI
jgi:hypothetical protein